MKIDQKDYQEHDTPYDYSYSPDTDCWYKDDTDFIPEPKQQTTILDKLVLEDVLNFSCDSIEENKKEFNEFIKYNFGVNNGEDSYGFSLKNILLHPNEQRYNDATIAVEMYYFDSIIEFANHIKESKNATVYIESFSGVKFFAWQKEDNKVRFVIQNYSLYESYKNDFIYIYDVLVDKSQLVTELERVVTKYINKVKRAIKKYEKENFACFTNLRQNSCLEKWLNLKDGTYKDWKARKFITATKLKV